ncbi:MAG TPA: PepSY-like domain-containing protein [Chitinophagaceae bacterium]
MKTFSILFFAALIAGSNLFKTPDANVASKYLTKPSVSCSTADTVIVPVAIQTSFDTKYPKATRVIWYQYTPDKTMPADPTAWYYGLDDKDYYVTFYWDDADYIAWYDNGAWIRSSQRIDNIDIPADVMRAVNTQYPGYSIADVDLEHDNKQTLYEVKLVKGDTKWNVHYTPTGTVARKKERHLTKYDPQAEMTTDFTTRYPNSSEVVWYRYTPDDRVDLYPTDWDYNMDATDYEVKFKRDGTEYSAWYDNGKWVRTESMTMNSNNAKLPANINDLLKTQYSGYTVKDVETEQSSTRTVYEIELAKGNEKCKVFYTAEGAIIKKKCRTV